MFLLVYLLVMWVLLWCYCEILLKLVYFELCMLMVNVGKVLVSLVF